MKKFLQISCLLFLFTSLVYSQNDCPPDNTTPTLKGQTVKWCLNESSMADLHFKNQLGGPFLSRNEYTAIVRSAISNAIAA